MCSWFSSFFRAKLVGGNMMFDNRHYPPQDDVNKELQNGSSRPPSSGWTTKRRYITMSNWSLCHILRGVDVNLSTMPKMK